MSSVVCLHCNMTNVVSKDAIPLLDYLKSAFRSPTYDSRIADTTYDFHYPVSGTRNTTCLRWVIPRSSGNKVPNIEKLILALDLKCVNSSKTGKPPIGITSAPTNNFINSIFGKYSRIRIRINQRGAICQQCSQ